MRVVWWIPFLLSAACSSKPVPKAPVVTPLPNVKFELVEAAAEGGSSDTGYWPTFLRDPSGRLHISFCDANLGDAKIAHEKPEGGWDIETVDGKGAVGKYISGDWGPDGPELVYLDQTRKTLRYAKKSGEEWKFQSLGSDNEDLGISGSFRISPGGERAYAYYNTRNELLLAVGRKGEAGIVWETSKIARAGVVHTIVLDLAFPGKAELVLAYPDWAVSRSALYFGRIPDLTLQKPDKESTLATKLVDDEAIAGLKTQLVRRGSTYDVLYMTGRGGQLYLAKNESGAFVREPLSLNVANIASTLLPDGRLAVAMQVGRADGLGEGALHYGERDTSGKWTEHVIDDARPVGQYLAITPLTKGGRVAIAYYDGVKKGLKVARIP